MAIPLAIVCVLFIIAAYIAANLDDTLIKERNEKKALQQELEALKNKIQSNHKNYD